MQDLWLRRELTGAQECFPSHRAHVDDHVGGIRCTVVSRQMIIVLPPFHDIYGTVHAAPNVHYKCNNLVVNNVFPQESVA